MANAGQGALSLDALGLLYLLTHYVEPDYHGSVLTHLTDLTTSRHRAIRTALRELENGGWVTLTRDRGPGGQLGPAVITVNSDKDPGHRSTRAPGRTELSDILQGVLDEHATTIVSKVDDSVEFDTGYAAVLLTGALIARGLVRMSAPDASPSAVGEPQP